MSDPSFFKTAAFGGFDKKSVLSYIDSLNEGFRATEQGYQEKLDAYDKAQSSQLAHIKKLEAQLAEQTAKLEAVAAQLERERELARHSQEQLDQLEEKGSRLEKQLSSNERELQIQLERNRQLQFRAESLDFKSKKYDEISNQIGDTIIEAKQNADAIIASANAQAREISANARTQMQSFYAELASFKGDSARLRRSVEEILFVLNDRIDVMAEVVSQIEKRLDPDSLCPSLTVSGEAKPFEQPIDEAGYLGGGSVEHTES